MKFNPPNASHRGGVYERLIGISRRVMEGILLNNPCQLNDESFLTILCQIMWTVNSRPLSIANLNDPLSLEPLTANLLLTQKGCSPHPFDDQTISQREGSYSRIQWKRVQHLSQEFARRWEREVLLEMQLRQKWQSSSPNLEVDDLVLIIEEQEHRSHWKMGRVISVDQSPDGLVRSAAVRTADQNIKERAIQKLVFLLRPKK